ncbi:MAG TPA: hypothetical protein VG368_04765, partial [Acidimicrobiales bacterium]|nr:hypothetical protein [Acidimicrobiales bacterium]
MLDPTTMFEESLLAAVASAPLEKRADDLDRLFAQSPPGPIPSGIGRGSAIVVPGSRAAKTIAEIAKMLLWQGKVFDGDRHDLLNLVTPFSLRAFRAQVYESESWVDGNPCIVLDYSKASLVARAIRDEIRLIGNSEYLGVVFVGRRRLPLRF